ncbi:MAG TPA: hypothetical protein P5098_02050 [Candidatus Dojkabacteria bacterium]|nr:hypothetical protein [Candidatus Dojkabacteria bacterium]
MAYNKEYYEKTKEKAIAASKKYYEQNKEKRAQQAKEWQKKHYAENYIKNRKSLIEGSEKFYYSHHDISSTMRLFRAALLKNQRSSPTIVKRTGYDLDVLRAKLDELGVKEYHKGWTFKDAFGSCSSLKEAFSLDKIILI